MEWIRHLRYPEEEGQGQSYYTVYTSIPVMMEPVFKAELEAESEWVARARSLAKPEPEPQSRV